MHEQAVRFKYEKIWKRQAFNLVLFKSTACADILELSAGNVVLICFRTNISFSITSFLNTIHTNLWIVDEDKRQNNFIHLLSNIVFRWILTNFLLFVCLGFTFISGFNVLWFPIFVACLSNILILNFLLRGHSLPAPFTEYPNFILVSGNSWNGSMVIFQWSKRLSYAHHFFVWCFEPETRHSLFFL